MSDDFAANFPPLVSREQAGNAVGRALNLFVGRGRQFSVKELANASGVKDRMIECAKLQFGNIDYRPLPDWAFMSIARFLGPAFTTAALAPTGQVAGFEGEVNHDELAGEAIAYVGTLASARHPNSPGGTEITDGERIELDQQAERLRAVPST